MRARVNGGVLLVIGYWLLVVGCWLLVVGCWLLVVGCWLLVVVRISRRFPRIGREIDEPE